MSTQSVRNEDPAEYTVFPERAPAQGPSKEWTDRAEQERLRKRAYEDQVIAGALRILAGRVCTGASIQNPTDLRNWLTINSAGREHEIFSVIFLNATGKILGVEEMFRGTLTQASVYPREVVKAALKWNANGIILHHNHPSGSHVPSKADHVLTAELVKTLKHVEVRVLDHVITGGNLYTSMAEAGMM